MFKEINHDVFPSADYANLIFTVHGFSSISSGNKLDEILSSSRCVDG